MDGVSILDNYDLMRLIRHGKRRSSGDVCIFSSALGLTTVHSYEEE